MNPIIQIRSIFLAEIRGQGCAPTSLSTRIRSLRDVQNIGLSAVLERDLSIAARRFAHRRRLPRGFARFRVAAAQAGEQRKAMKIGLPRSGVGKPGGSVAWLVPKKVETWLAGESEVLAALAIPSALSGDANPWDLVGICERPAADRAQRGAIGADSSSNRGSAPA